MRYKIAKKILDEEKLSVLYVDNDTILKDYIYDLIEDKNLYGYIFEDGKIKWWFDLNEHFSFGDHLTRNFNNFLDMKIINNGVLWFPYNQNTIEHVNNIVNCYDYIYDKYGSNWGLDQTVFTILYYCCCEPKNIDSVYVKSNQKIVHYYNFKFFKQTCQTVLINFLKTNGIILKN